MATAVFKAGDRVQTRRTTVVLQGTPGTVQQPSMTVADAYLVRFDKWPTPQLIHVRDLATLPGNT
jgi:hypothetical protein